jgi:hypothetical protein
LDNDALTVELLDYYNENWNNCEEMWVKFHRLGLPTFLSETNNPVEIIHKQTKVFGKKNNGFAKCIKDNISYITYSKQCMSRMNFLARSKSYATQTTGSVDRDKVKFFFYINS